MELQHPLAVITPTVDGDVLAALTSAQAWFTTGELHRVIPERSQEGIRLTLRRLSIQGIVEVERVGPTLRYRLNREHLAAQALTALVDQRAEFLRRLSSQFGIWTAPPRYAAVFGSAARGEMRPDSDIDLFIVGPDDVPAGDEDATESIWATQIAELSQQVTRWTGNDARALEMTVESVRTAAASDPVLASIAREGLTVFGSPHWLRRLVAGLVAP